MNTINLQAGDYVGLLLLGLLVARCLAVEIWRARHGK